MLLNKLMKIENLMSLVRIDSTHIYRRTLKLMKIGDVGKILIKKEKSRRVFFIDKLLENVNLF